MIYFMITKQTSLYLVKIPQVDAHSLKSIQISLLTQVLYQEYYIKK